MKRLFSDALIMVLAIMLVTVTAASAESGQELPYYVSDTVGLTTSEQWQKLETAAERISDRYGCGVYAVSLQDYRDYGSYSNIRNFSEEFYNHYRLGLGQNRNGILLVLSMAERDYCLIAYGSDAHYAFTDYGKEVLENSFLDDFKRNDWNGGLADYISGCEELLSKAAEGKPVDVQYESRSNIPTEVSTGIIIGVPLLVSFGACEGMKRRMKPVKPQNRADEYIVPGGIHLSLKRDVFVNRTVSRTVIRTENRDSTYGGGGTTVNSGGFSGHSGKF